MFTCVSLSIHFPRSRPLFITSPSKRTMVAIDLHMEQLLRYSSLGKGGHSIIKFLKIRGRELPFKAEKRLRYVNPPSLKTLKIALILQGSSQERESMNFYISSKHMHPSLQQRAAYNSYDMEATYMSVLGKEYVKAVCRHPVYSVHLQSTSCEMSDLMKHKLESRL